MATLPQEFIELAAELIGDEFAAFASDAVITQTTGFDYATQMPTTRAQTIKMIRLEFNEKQFAGELVKVGDYLLVGQYRLLSWLPSSDNTTLVHDGITSQIVRVTTDPAKAAVFLHVRRA